MTLIIFGLVIVIFSQMLVINNVYHKCLSFDPIFKILKEHGPGLSLKFPWAKIEGKTSLKTDIIVTSGGIFLMPWEKFIKDEIFKKIDGKSYETKNGILYGVWATAFSVGRRKGSLLNFILKTPQVAALMLMAEIDLFIGDKIIPLPNNEAQAQKLNISDALASYFGNEGNASPFEDRFGIDIINPKLFDLNLGDESKKSAEGRYAVTLFKESMDELADDITDGTRRADVILALNKISKRQTYAIDDLEKATGNISAAVLNFITRKTTP